MEREIERMTQAIQQLTDQLAVQNETNQKILMALMDLVLGEDESDVQRTDMDGNPI